MRGVFMIKTVALVGVYLSLSGYSAGIYCAYAKKGTSFMK